MNKQSAIVASICTALLAIAISVAISGCAELQRENEMNEPDRLAPCPDSPNCVSSDAQNTRHAVAPMHLVADPATGWTAIQEIINQMPRTKIIEATDRYLHITFKSRLWGFIDDLELKLDPQTNIISIRSASRSGKYDFGVNRRRVEDLRNQLKASELIL